MRQLALELFPPNRDYVGKVLQEEPVYVKILGPIEWSMKWDSLVAVAQVEGSICIISLTERSQERDLRSFAVRHLIPNA